MDANANTASGLAEMLRNYVSGWNSYSQGRQTAAPTWTGPAAYGLRGYYNGERMYNWTEGDMNSVLARLRQFDPNAAFTQGEEQFGEASTRPYYQLSFDQSKLPAATGGEAVTNYGTYGRNRLFNDALTYNDPNYGPMTVGANINMSDSGDRLMRMLGPALIGGFMGLGAGGGSWLTQLFSKLPQMGQTVSSLAQGPVRSSVTPQQLMLLALLSRMRG
jgi:hypothetical protein